MSDTKQHGAIVSGQVVSEWHDVSDFNTDWKIVTGTNTNTYITWRIWNGILYINGEGQMNSGQSGVTDSLIKFDNKLFVWPKSHYIRQLAQDRNSSFYIDHGELKYYANSGTSDPGQTTVDINWAIPLIYANDSKANDTTTPQI